MFPSHLYPGMHSVQVMSSVGVAECHLDIATTSQNLINTTLSNQTRKYLHPVAMCTFVPQYEVPKFNLQQQDSKKERSSLLLLLLLFFFLSILLFCNTMVSDCSQLSLLEYSQCNLNLCYSLVNFLFRYMKLICLTSLQ